MPSELESSTIDLHIGNDYYLDLILPQKIEIQPGLYMLGSKLGWILAGRTPEPDKKNEHSLLVVTYGTTIERETNLSTCADKSLPTKQDVEDFWRLESIGIQDTTVDSKSRKRSMSRKRSKARKRSKSRKRSKARKRSKSRKRLKSKWSNSRKRAKSRKRKIRTEKN